MAPSSNAGEDEMHELNQEADYLDQTVTVDANGVNGVQKHEKEVSRERSGSDPDAQAQLIDSLRSQIQDLFSQVSQLNNKLVTSYDRVSDLEDELHVTSTNLRSQSTKVTQLETERSQHMAALSTGLLVEKSHVTAELTRLMEQATEEAAKAGEAVNARQAIEKELDDLSAGLFAQANTMVAEARLSAARSERKVEETEEALKGAEEIVGVLQLQMQALQSDKEEADKKVEEMRALVGKGKWIEKPLEPGRPTQLKLFSIHAPYSEYIQFIVHLRTIRPTNQQPPAMSTLLPLPFLARLVAEDSDPTVRLDLAPSLNWLTRRSVLSAIHSGQLTVEPMSTTTLLEELSTPTTISGLSHSHVNCALCGATILESISSPTVTSPQTPSRTGSKPGWSSTLLRNTIVQSIASYGSRPSTPGMSAEPPLQVYIFRLETTSSSGLPVSIPLASQQAGAQPRQATIYPLCTSGWCLTRLRATCSLWAFIRTSVVEKVWEDEPYVPPPSVLPPKSSSLRSDLGLSPNDGLGTPQLTQKRSRMGIGALWGSMSRSLSSGPKPETEVTKPTEEVPKDIEKPVPAVPPRRLPPPPPQHSSAKAPPPSTASPPENRATTLAAAETTTPALPQRNRHRPVPPPPTVSNAQNGNEHPDGAAETGKVAEPPKSIELPKNDPHETVVSPPFATPPEEIPVHVRPVSPAAIPLPPSAPSTPRQSTFNPPAVPPRRNPGGPHRTGTPPPAAHSSENRPPSRSGSPAPPPLPRRAAARARPSSLIMTPPISAPAPEPLPQTTEEPHKTESAPQPAEPTIATTPPATSLVTEEAHSQEQTDIAREGPIQHSVLTNPEDGDDAIPASTLVSEPKQISAEDAAEKPQEELAELDMTLYVSDATWEERTWKELVRLRENMFWARIGGMR